MRLPEENASSKVQKVRAKYHADAATQYCPDIGDTNGRSFESMVLLGYSGFLQADY
jgi:hypothetical protein